MFVLLQTLPEARVIAVSKDKQLLMQEEVQLYQALTNKELASGKIIYSIQEALNLDVNMADEFLKKISG